MDKNEEKKAAIVIKSIHTACNQYSWGFGKHKVCFWIITAKKFLINLEQKLNEKKRSGTVLNCVYVWNRKEVSE